MHTYEIQLRRTDIDAQHHVNNVVFAQFLDDARTNLLERHRGPGAPWRVVVAGQRLGYRAPLIFRDAPVTVTSVVERIGTTSFTLAHEIRDDENLYLAATSTLVAIDGHAPRSLTDSEREYLMTLAAPRA
ncbi:acyl-CoA thioesterase [Nocardia yunnanensis]|uniref:Acyl-CoA thioesterase n=1 Tax=Nocardia yunnanensis TaxID=2382165 RepID=A0A386Z993_9NOCA|nr:thioesterase family protein [Nocardia yunnanensis]AYF74220.1 acyl-CoA thioesterase [Nocardia yunnanensis]